LAIAEEFIVVLLLQFSKLFHASSFLAWKQQLLGIVFALGADGDDLLLLF
jgi:hypothetical protein